MTYKYEELYLRKKKQKQKNVGETCTHKTSWDAWW